MKKEKQNKQKILLHICCAPDATYPFEVLSKDYEVIGFFYNPNIEPETEELRRTRAAENIANDLGFTIVSVCNDKTESENWKTYIKGLGSLDEGGTRCFKCMKFRLEKAAEKARELNIPNFTTTLTVSPHKNAFLINSTGTMIGNEKKINFIENNFKKNEGFKKTLGYSDKFNIYRQNYCGCSFSRRTI